MNEFFEIVVREKYKAVYGFLFSMVREKQLAEELTQDTFLVLVKKINTLDRAAPIMPWLLTTAKNLAWNAQKKQNLKKRIFLEGNTSLEFWKTIDGEDLFLDNHIKALEHCLSELTDQQSEAVKMFYNEKFSCIEIAKKLNLAVEAVYNRLTRVRKSLRRCIEKKMTDSL